MAKPKFNQFVSWELTPDEIEASKLNALQIMYLQNECALVAVQKNNLEFNPSLENAVLDYAQKEAYMKGQIDTYQALLASLGSDIPIF